MNRILIIDDDEDLCRFMEDLGTSIGHEAASALTLKKGMEKAVSVPFDVIFLDVGLPDGNGLEAVPEFRKTPSEPEVIIMTGEGTGDGAEQAIRSGAWDYIQKPVTAQHAVLTLKRAIDIRRERASHAGAGHFKRDGMAGESSELIACLEDAARASGSTANVLITGESGTGKELLAHAIHENSTRAGGPFAVVDCAALPDSLVESVLFGHEKGAFTGADRSRKGLFSEANGGTLFLDEVGELLPSSQKRFLRVLQERSFRTVGGSRDESIDFRLIAATNRNIDAMVSEGAFRPDLLFRLRGVDIHLPPLRDRGGDIRILTLQAIEKSCSRLGISVKGFYPEMLEALAQYPWPGNVRELLAAVEAAVIQAKGEPVLHPVHLPIYIRSELARTAVTADPQESEWAKEADTKRSPQLTHAEYMRLAEKDYLERVASTAKGNIQEICRISGLSRAQVYRLIKKHDIIH